ncbi:hypothetical protein KSW81_008350 [Nannochloris sp. 'desiccata']|nr:hypothetical protein KSW81_008350 [Chlorella desiccata (nom. nud.)]
MATMGLGAGTMLPSSNFMAWLQYLKPTAIRYFVTSINKWEAFITGRTKSAWGSSFFGKTVVTEQASWDTAVQELRQASSSPGQPDIFDWIQTDQTVRWSQFVRTLTRDNPDEQAAQLPQSMICSGNPTQNLPNLQAAGFSILGIWHVTCKNLPLKSLDRNSPEYWKERWELYRWFYLGGRFFAQNNIKDIELYNEPDNDPCLSGKAWLDDMRVRSLALQHAYRDYSLWSSGKSKIVPNLICPPMSAPKFDIGIGGTAYGKLAVLDIHTQFPELATISTYWNSKVFSYHQYNSPGYGMRSAWDKIVPSVKAADNRQTLPVYISEHNTYAASTAETAVGKDVMDSASTAALLGGQVISMVGRAVYTSVHKFSQTFSTSASGVHKNGLVWADLGKYPKAPGLCDVGGSTKSAEAYRLLLKRTPGRKKLAAYTSVPLFRKISNFSTFTTSDSLGYYVYFANAGAGSETMTLAMSKLKNVAARSPVVITAVTSTLQGEVYSIPTISSAKTLKFTVPGNSLLMATVPIGAVATALVPASGDAYVSAGSKSRSAVNEGGTSPTLFVQTSSSNDQSLTRAAFFKFKLPAQISRSKIVSAVLRITQESTTVSGGPQILTVLGTNDDTWSETTLNWSDAPGLLPSNTPVTSVSQNFIDYTSAKLVGMMTAGANTKTKTMSLDVGDYLREGGVPSFLLTRMFRFDARGSGAAALQGDVLGGAVALVSREGRSASGRPVLRIIYKK